MDTSQKAEGMYKRYKAIFHPQAWVNDYAVDVDPEGETEWDVTDYLTQLGYRMIEQPENNTYESDELRWDPKAPTWIQSWSGPFWIEIVNS